MPYTIRLSDGSIFTTIADQTIDTSTLPLALVGRGAINYGTDFAENFVYLLENFNSTSPPKNPLIGQFWFDRGTNKMRFYVGQWIEVTTGTPSSLSLPNTIVYRDQYGNFSANVITANLQGIADSARRWTTARTLSLIGDVAGSASIDGSADVALGVVVNHSATADRWTTGRTLTLIGDAAGTVTFDGSGNITLPVNVQHSALADRWTYTRTLNLTGAILGTVSVDGSGNMTLVTSFNTSSGGTGGDGSNGGTGGTGGAVPITVTNALNANHATNADYATNAGHAASADYATNAGHANNADYATNAGHANNADNAVAAQTATRLVPGRRISISGAVSGSQVFDGNSDINIGTSSNAGSVDTSGFVRKTGDSMSGGLSCPLFYVDDGLYLTIGSSAIDGGPCSRIQVGGGQYIGFARNSGILEYYNPYNAGIYCEHWSNSGDLYCRGNVVAYSNFSDIRLKSNIIPLSPTESLELVKKLNGYSYDKFNDYTKETKPEVGVIAQEVEALIPTAVGDYRDTKTVHHEQIVPYLIEAIKALEARIVDLEQKLADK